MESDSQPCSSQRASVIPTILCGGAGSRLWPMSRSDLPKPFIKLDDNQSLLQKAFLRASSLCQGSEILTICNSRLLSRILDEYDSINSENIKTSFILEPFGRNTAPAIAAAASYISKEHSGETNMLILAADHLIDNLSNFQESVRQAEKLASKGNLVAFGIPPHSPETGYGYIEYKKNSIVKFVEKPSLDQAKEYLNSGRYLWNSGMFCFTAEGVINEMNVHCPDLLDMTAHCVDISKNNNLDSRYEMFLDPDSFRLVDNISFDYAVMEKTRKASVIHANIGWSDIGDWKTLGDLAKPDADNNRLRGRIIQKNSHDTTVISENRTVGIIGLKNLIVVDTHDALLISDKDEVQGVREIYSQLDTENDPAAREHKEKEFSWGTLVTLEKESNYTIQKLIINRNQEVLIPREDIDTFNCLILLGEVTISTDESIQSIKRNEHISISGKSEITIHNSSEESAIVIVLKST